MNMLRIYKTVVLVMLLSCLSIGKCVELESELDVELLDELMNNNTQFEQQVNDIGTTTTSATVIDTPKMEHSYRSLDPSTGETTSGGGFNPSQIFQHYKEVF